MVKKFSSLIVLMTMAVSVAACGGAKEGTETSSPKVDPAGTPTTASTTAPVKQTVIKMIGWQQQATNDWIKEFNKKFEAAHPEYKIDYTIVLPNDPYKQLMATRINADDVDIWPDASSFIRGAKDFTPGADKPVWQNWIEAGKLLDLTDQPFVKNYKADDIAKANTFNGKVYSISTGTVATDGLFYNKKMFEENGWTLPTKWSEFETLLKAIKAKGISPIGTAGKDTWPLNLLAMGLEASIFDDQDKFVEGLWKGTAKYTDPQPIEIYTKAKTLMDNYMIPNFMGIDYNTLPKLFTSGKVAMVSDGSWAAGVYEKAGMSIGYFPVPGNEDPAKNQSLAGKYDLTFHIGAKSKNSAGALKWLEEFSQPEVYKTFAQASGFEPTQDVVLDSPFSKSIAQYNKVFKLAYEQVFIDKPNAGEHIKNGSMNIHFLAPGGPFKTPQDFAAQQQKEWDAAK